MKKQREMALFLGMAAAMSFVDQPVITHKKQKPPIPKKKPKPKGVKEFHFSQTGEMFTEKNEHIVFSCYCRNESNARRKFINSRFKI